MMCFPSMLSSAAEQAGMKVPKNPDRFSKVCFPHFAVFCNVQLNRALSFWGEHFENARIIADIPDADISKITLEGLLARGLHYRS